MVGRDGKAVPVNGLHYGQPVGTGHGQFQLADGQVVGVARPVIIQFDAAIGEEDDRREKALKVTTDQPAEGKLGVAADEEGGSRVHYRTKEYYPAGTNVAVDAKLYGVKFGDGAYGAEESR